MARPPMTRPRGALVPAAFVLALAACASPAPSPPQAAVSPPPASDGIDGVYRAPPGGVHGSSGCGTTVFSNPIRVIGGVASLQTVTAGRLEGKAAPDGSVLIEQGRSTLRGKFDGNVFNGSYTRASRGTCSFTLHYEKAPPGAGTPAS